MSEEPYLITFGEILVGQVFESTQNKTFRYRKKSVGEYVVIYDKVTGHYFTDKQIYYMDDGTYEFNIANNLRIFYIPTGRISIWI